MFDGFAELNAKTIASGQLSLVFKEAPSLLPLSQPLVCDAVWWAEPRGVSDSSCIVPPL